jgi:hypothetical protein
LYYFNIRFLSLAGIIPLPKYFYCEWSLARLRIDILNSDIVIGFNDNNELLVFSKEGIFYVSKFDQLKGGLFDCCFEASILFNS